MIWAARPRTVSSYCIRAHLYAIILVPAQIEVFEARLPPGLSLSCSQVYHESMREKPLWITAVILGVMASPAAAGDNENTRQSLKGLRGLSVLVEALETEVERNGLNKASIQTDVELKLRQAGIAVLTEAGSHAAPGEPFLYVNVSTSGGPLYAYSIEVEFRQTVRLDRDPSIKIFGATTWSVGGGGAVGQHSLRDIRDGIEDYVDGFINAYLSVNPKR